MKKILYYDCFAGISGDMHLAAMIDIGVPVEYLLDELQKLSLTGYQLEATKVVTHGITSTRVNVHITDQDKQRVLQVGHLLPPASRHSHPHEHHAHRSFTDIQHMIESSTLSDSIKKLSIKIFERLAIAEGKIHNIPTEQVHFHEVGAIDSIVDIVGAAVCLDYLKPDSIISSPVELGSGTVRCAHGVYPVPAPATAELLHNVPVTLGKVPFEATTPTGAAILATVVDEFQKYPSFILEKIGYGAGTRDSDIPNVLRVYLGQADTKRMNLHHDNALLIECNIDDMNPELFEHVVNKLFESGAQDVFIAPILMKKMRPAQKLSVLCNREEAETIIKILLQETTTLGVREYAVNKWILDRKIIQVETSLGKVRVKKSFGDGVVKYKPEYDDCLEIAKKKNIPLLEVMRLVGHEIADRFSENITSED